MQAVIEVIQGRLRLSEVEVGDPPVVECIRVIRVEAEGLVVVLDGPLGLPKGVVGDPPVLVPFGELRVQA